MPYQAGKRLSGERASKIGHLDVINSPLVNEIIHQFEKPEPAIFESKATWEEIEQNEKPLRLIFAVDGSLQTIKSDLPPYKELSFIKTALLRLDQHEMNRLDPDAPHPMALRDIMSEAALYHATVLPLRGIRVKGKSNYDAIRQIIFDSVKDPSLSGEPYATLKWIAYEQWTQEKRNSPNFNCPNCDKEIQGLPFNADEGTCRECKGHLYLTDMIGFHLEMADDSAPDSVASAYMLIHETLMLFTGIRHFWEKRKYNVLKNALFLKDGPLTLRSQYSKLVIPIRRFFEFAKSKGISINVAGQEKTGAFVDHLAMIAKQAPENSYSVLSNNYIRGEVQQKPDRAEQYGSRTNYGNKLFVKLDKYHYLVLSIPTGEYIDSNSINDLIGANSILSTLPTILSHRHECALVPIELVNGVASLSSYPSAAVLKIFADI